MSHLPLAPTSPKTDLAFPPVGPAEWVVLLCSKQPPDGEEESRRREQGRGWNRPWTHSLEKVLVAGLGA